MESTRVASLVSYAGAVGFGMLVGVRLREQPVIVTLVALAALAVFCAWQIFLVRQIESQRTQAQNLERRMLELLAPQQTTPLPTS